MSKDDHVPPLPPSTSVLPPGAAPAVPQPQAGSQPYVLPPPARPGPSTWQVIGGFLAAAAIIAGGVLVVADRFYVGKETYRLDREADIKTRTELKAAVSTLTTSVGNLNNKLDSFLPNKPVPAEPHRPPSRRPR